MITRFMTLPCSGYSFLTNGSLVPSYPAESPAATVAHSQWPPFEKGRKATGRKRLAAMLGYRFALRPRDFSRLSMEHRADNVPNADRRHTCAYLGSGPLSICVARRYSVLAQAVSRRRLSSGNCFIERRRNGFFCNAIALGRKVLPKRSGLRSWRSRSPVYAGSSLMPQSNRVRRAGRSLNSFKRFHWCAASGGSCNSNPIPNFACRPAFCRDSRCFLSMTSASTSVFLTIRWPAP